MNTLFSVLIIETSPDFQACIDQMLIKDLLSQKKTQWYHRAKMTVMIQHLSTYPLLSAWIQPVPSLNKETVTGWG